MSLTEHTRRIVQPMENKVVITNTLSLSAECWFAFDIITAKYTT